jgi:drug/metabolite transporter (DMT)-like permease
MIKEQVTRNNILGIVISSVGMLMLFLLGASDFSIGNKWGILMAALSVSTAVLYSAVLRRIPKQYNSLSIVFYIQLFSLILFYPLWAFSEGGTISQTVAQWGANAEWWQAFAAVIYLAAFSSVTAYILFCYTVRQLGITRANSFNNIRPVFTALIMFVCFGEVLPVGKIAGIAMIIIGLFVSQKKSAKQ